MDIVTFPLPLLTIVNTSLLVICKVAMVNTIKRNNGFDITYIVLGGVLGAFSLGVQSFAYFLTVVEGSSRDGIIYTALASDYSIIVISFFLVIW